MNAKTAATLRAKAASLDKKIAHYFHERQTNTRKRAEEDRYARQEGKKFQCIQAVMRKVADLNDAGTVPDELAGLRDIATFERSVGCVLATERQISEYPRNGNESMRDRWTAEQRAVHAIILGLDSSPLQESPTEKLHRLERDIKLRKIPGFFPTGAAAVRQVIELADIEDGMSVLEPSAGNGAIADAALAAGGRVDACEANPDLREILRLKGHTLLPERDFLGVTPENGLYDRVLMNPPFENHQDIDHVAHAYKLLKPGGVLVAIMSPSGFFRGTNKAEEFRTWFHGIDGAVEDLPSGFAEMTGVPGKLVTISKPALPAARLDCDYCESIETMTGVRHCPIHGAANPASSASSSPIPPMPHASDCATWVKEPCDCVTGSDPLAGQADTEFNSRLDAQRVTLEFQSKSTRHIDSGRVPIEESPLWGGRAQGELFG